MASGGKKEPEVGIVVLVMEVAASQTQAFSNVVYLCPPTAIESNSTFNVQWLPFVQSGLTVRDSAFACTVHLCVFFLYGFQSKQRLFPYIVLADWFL